MQQGKEQQKKKQQEGKDSQKREQSREERMKQVREQNREELLRELLDWGLDERWAHAAVQRASTSDGAIELALRLSEMSSRLEMVMVVNMSLKMGKGKICAQVGHAMLGAYRQAEEVALYDSEARVRLAKWEAEGTPLYLLRAQEEQQMMRLSRIVPKACNICVIRDAGRTQIKAGSKTVLAIGPIQRHLIQIYAGDLKPL